MSINQPTLTEHLLKQKEIIYSYLALLQKHEPSWGEPEQYSARRTRKHLNDLLAELDRTISWCKGV